MPADLPPNSPERPTVEIVPLGPPSAEPAPPTAGIARPVPTSSRAFPHLVVDPIPTWPAPAMRTTRHPGATLLALADAVPGVRLDDEADDLASLTSLVRAPRVVLDLVPLDDPATPDAAAIIDLTDAPAPAAPRDPSLLDATRLRALLARERAGLEIAAAEPAAAPTDAPHDDASPFPLPTTTARRTPKAVREDVTPVSLRAEVAAAMARATGAAPAPAPGRARDRLELVPLGEPAEPVIDLRAATTAPSAASAYACSACGTAGVIEVIDQIVGEVHVSCPSCFRMWRTPVTAPASFEGR